MCPVEGPWRALDASKRTILAEAGSAKRQRLDSKCRLALQAVKMTGLKSLPREGPLMTGEICAEVDVADKS